MELNPGRQLALCLARQRPYVVGDLVQLIAQYAASITYTWHLLEDGHTLVFRERNGTLQFWLAKTANGWFHFSVKGKLEHTICWPQGHTELQTWGLDNIQPRKGEWEELMHWGPTWTIRRTGTSAEIQNSSDKGVKIQVNLDGTISWTTSGKSGALTMGGIVSHPNL
eukprot:TRINITY_DN8393_c0_g1_i1.p1 TRINITY_DN8393_c0_g1~~TRINITY_DN8393_c0_g1_i1.p1  ORF type:complete len:177 (-),score=35.63 TRINITY_DN8393_c0_g1_i1:106-606(-)